ncbi:SCO family protein [Microvirga sp. VF16]|uniref:SCO family protein n=1 Tax=Microvirga sp. VF16 TaxID=2807101 RepID=UPI00193CBC99|nr:SCO family protein [Microvirga sp. VF16]QRM34684.1 SCO family protein [Microvirga sp. VF16]
MRLPSLLVISASLALIAVTPVPTLAHSLDSLQNELHKKELYFEVKDRPAPDFALQDANGKAYRLSDLRGKVVVLHFIYVGCTDVCPLHAELIAQIQEMINSTPMRNQVQFLSITTDPERDTPDILRAYGESRGLKLDNWAFLTTTPGMAEDATRKLAEQFGHKFTKTDDGMQMHGVVTHVIDREGRWRANFHGLRFERTNLVTYINALVNDHDKHDKRSLWERLRSRF